MQTTRFSRYWVIAAALVLGACSPQSNPTTGGQALATCEIVEPQTGASFGAADDRDLQTPDIQIDVAVRVAAAPVGGTLQLELNGAPASTLALDAAAGIFRFAGVTLPRGPAAARVGCSIIGTPAHAESSVNIGESCALAFATPTMGQNIGVGDTRLGANGLPVYPVEVQSSGLPAGTPVQLTLGEDAAPQFQATATLSPGRATFEVPAHQGLGRLSARAIGAACSPTAETRYTVDLGMCATQLVLPRTFNGASDTSPASGLQTRLCVATACADGSQASLRIEGGTELQAPVANGQACFEVTIPEGSPSITARIDGPSQSGVALPVRPCVDVTPPALAVAYPQTGLVLGAQEDRDPSTPNVLDLPVNGSADGLTESGCTASTSQGRVEIRVNGELQHSFTPDGARGAFERMARLLPGRNLVQVCAFDSVENRTCSPAANVRFDSAIPSLRITSPTDGAVRNAQNRAFEIVVEAERLAKGTLVSLQSSDGRWRCQAPVVLRDGPSAAIFTVGGDCGSMTDGTWQVQARAVDALGNPAVSQTLVFSIDTIAPGLVFNTPDEGALVREGTIDVTLKTDAADGVLVSLSINDAAPRFAPASGGGVTFRGVSLGQGETRLSAVVRDAAGNVATVVRTIGRDSHVPVPVFANLVAGAALGPKDDADQDLSNGLQYDVRIDVADEADGARVQLQVGERAPSELRLAAGVALFSGVSFAEGVNRVVVIVQDAAGNVGRSELSVTVATGRPAVTIVEPRDGAVLSARHDVDLATPGVQVPVSIAVAGAAGLTTCSVNITNGAWARTQELALQGSFCRGVLTLAEGTSTLVAQVAAQVSSSSVPTTVSIDTLAPTLQLVAPAGTYLNAGSPDVDGRPGFQTNIIVQGDVEAGEGATLRVTSDETGITMTYFASFDDTGTASFNAVTLGEPSANVLEITAFDRAGNAAAPLLSRVIVDREPPALRLLSPTPNAVFGLAADESPEAGFQKTVSVQVGGAEVGSVVELTLSGTGAGDVASTYRSEPLAAGQQLVTFTAVTFPSVTGGSVIIDVGISDEAGNRGTDRIIVSLDLDTGRLAWSYPQVVPSPTVLCGAADANPSLPGHQVELQLSAGGLENGTVVVVRDAADAEVGRGIVVGGAAAVVATLGEGNSTLRAYAEKASGNVAMTEETRAVRVDSQGPAIVALACNGDQNGDGFLNRAEDQNPASFHSFEMDCMVTFADDSASGREVQILSSAPSQGSIVGTANVTGNVAYVTVSLAGGASPISHRLVARGSDQCGNLSTSEVSFSGTVDLGAPAVAITAPTSGTLVAAHDLNPATETQLECCTGISGAYDITAATSGASGNARLYANGVPKAEAAIGIDGLARFSGASLPQGQVTLVVEAADVAGNVTASAPVSLFIDTVSPKLAIVSPTAGTVGSGNVTVQVQYSDLETDQVIRLYDGVRLLGQAPAAIGAESAVRVATFPVLLQAGAHSFTAQAVDLHGNPGSAAAVVLNVQGTEPLISFDAPAGDPMVIGPSHGVVAGSQITIQLSMRTPAVPGAIVTLYKNGGLMGTTTVAQGSPLNVAAFPVTLSHNEKGTFYVRVRANPLLNESQCPGDANNFCSTVVPFSVLLVAPTLAFSTPACKPFWSRADATGANVFNVAINTNAVTGQLVRLTSTLGGVSQSVGAEGGVVTFADLSLVDGQQTLEAHVTDAAGNVNSVQCSLEVDTQAPSAGTLTAARSAARRDRISLGFTMPGDDGVLGRVASYELRYKSCALGTACAITDATFAAATLVQSLPSIADGGTPMTHDVDSMPLDTNLGFALRATDNAGNVSAVATVEVQTAWTNDTTVAGIAAEADFGVALRYAYLRGGAKPDLIVGRAGLSTNKGGVRFVYGDGSAATEITAAQVGLGATATARLGRALSAAGDVDGDGYEDVLVAAPGVANATCTAGGASTGKVFLFFGGPTGIRGGAAPVSCASVGATADCYVELAPPAPTGVCGFGGAVSGLGRFSAGVAGSRPLIAVAANDLTVTSSRIGKVYIYRIVGDRPNVTVELAATISGSGDGTGLDDDFHFGASVCGVGDVNGDGIEDMVIGVTRKGRTPAVAGRAYLVLGNARFAGVGLAEGPVAGGASPTDGYVQLGNLVASDFFGTSCAHTGDMDGDGINDFAISAAGGAKVYMFRGRSDIDSRPSSLAPEMVTITHPSFTQTGEISGGLDVDGDGLKDLVIGDTNAVYVFRGDATHGVATSPISVFAMPAPTIATGFPVLLAPSLRDSLPGEQAFPDVVIGKVAGPVLSIRY